MECDPVPANVAVQTAAELVVPGTSVTGEQGSAKPLSVKFTLPVGGSPATVAVIVTAWPTMTGFGVALTLIDVDFLPIVSV